MNMDNTSRTSLRWVLCYNVLHSVALTDLYFGDFFSMLYTILWCIILYYLYLNIHKFVVNYNTVVYCAAVHCYVRYCIMFLLHFHSWLHSIVFLSLYDIIVLLCRCQWALGFMCGWSILWQPLCFCSVCPFYSCAPLHYDLTIGWIRWGVGGRRIVLNNGFEFLTIFCIALLRSNDEL